MWDATTKRVQGFILTLWILSCALCQAQDSVESESTVASDNPSNPKAAIGTKAAIETKPAEVKTSEVAPAFFADILDEYTEPSDQGLVLLAPETSLEAVPAQSDSDEAPIVLGAPSMESEFAPLCECMLLDCDSEEDDELAASFGDWLGYNSARSDMMWLAGGAEDLGMVSFESHPVISLGDRGALVFGSAMHLVNGPVITDLPSRLYDFETAVQSRSVHKSGFVLDMRLGAGIFTDFEGSSRKGIRFPGHAVTYWSWSPRFVSVLGVESLDRDDISVLPVAGFVWRAHEDLLLELVFPRPKIEVLMNQGNSLYVAGEIGGDTWAIERNGGPAGSGVNDNATYHDLRLIFGTMNYDDNDTALELGWAFDRDLNYRSGIGNVELDDVFFVRVRKLY